MESSFQGGKKNLFSFRRCELMTEVFYSILADKVNKVEVQSGSDLAAER